MNCAEFKEAAQALALDALEPDERVAALAHLAEAGPHDGCAEELDEARAAVALLATSLPPVRPPASVWEAIARQADLQVAAAPPPRSRGLAALPWMVAALAAALALFMWRGRAEVGAQLDDNQQALASAHHDLDRLNVSVAASASCVSELSALKDQLALHDEAVALLQLPATRVLPLAAQGAFAARATVVVNLAEHRGVIVASGLVAADGKDYELWVIRGDAKIAAGLLHGGDLIARIDPALLSSADAFAITLEPAGGGAVPRGQLVLVGVMPKG